MDSELIRRVNDEEKVAIKQWGRYDRTPEHLLAAATEELGEVAHAINHSEGRDTTEQEIVETIGILSRLWEMISGRV